MNKKLKEFFPLLDEKAINAIQEYRKHNMTKGTQDTFFPDLPSKKYEIIYCDPPWDYKGQLQHTGKGGKSSGGAIAHYNTVKLKDLKMLDVSSIASTDCLLFMWTSSPHLDQAIELGVTWGFQYATVAFIWHKQKKNPGYYTMSECEICLVFKKGKIPQPRGARNVPQFHSQKKGSHSKKPVEIRKRIETMFPEQLKIELFARQKAEGWDVWGNEV